MLRSGVSSRACRSRCSHCPRSCSSRPSGRHCRSVSASPAERWSGWSWPRSCPRAFSGRHEGNSLPIDVTETLQTEPLSDAEIERLDAYWRAANYLSVGQIYLLEQSAAARAARPGACQAASARSLRHDTGTEPRLCASQPRHPPARSQRPLRHRPGARRPGARREHVSRRNVQRGVPARRARRGRSARALPPVLVSRRDPESRRPRDTRLDPRGRRARLRARPRVRSGIRQSGSARRVRRRRRRSRDRAARDELAREQVPQPADGRCRAADPASERLQDREPDGAGAHSASTSWQR